MAESTCYGLEAKRFAVKAMTPGASGRQLSSRARHADIEGMRAALILSALLPSMAAAANASSRVNVSAVVLPVVRFTQEVGAPVRTVTTAGGTLYVLPFKGAASSYGGRAPSISVEGRILSVRKSSFSDSGSSVEGDVRVFVPEGSDARIVVTLFTDGAPPGVKTGT